MSASASTRIPGPRQPAVDRGRSGLRLRLRDETRTRHERLDAQFAGLGNADGGADYRRFLVVNEACHREIEPVLRRSALEAAMPHIGRGDRHAAAVADLAAMSVRPIVLDEFPLRSPGLGEAVGIAYVIEGSRLGARLILKRLGDSGRLDMRPPLTTFFLEAAGNAERFRDFLVFADTVVTSDSDGNDAIRAANATFDYFLEAVRIADTAECDGGLI